MNIFLHFGKDANPDGTVSPDEERRERELQGRIRRQVAEWKSEAYDIGGSFRGPGIWSRLRESLRG